MSKLAGLPKIVLDQVFEDQKKATGRGGNPDYQEFWTAFDQRALARRREMDELSCERAW